MDSHTSRGQPGASNQYRSSAIIFSVISIVLIATLGRGVVHTWEMLWKYSGEVKSTDGTIREASITHTSSSYHLDVQYEYAVDGKQYFGQRLSLLPPSFQYEEQATAAAAKFVKGAVAKVFYSSDHPEESTLSLEGMRKCFAISIGMMLFIVPWVVMTCRFAWKYRQSVKGAGG